MRALLALLLALAVASPTLAQSGAAGSRHLVGFRNDAELTRYLRSVGEAQARAQERAWKAAQRNADCAKAYGSAQRTRRRVGAGDTAVIAGVVRDVAGSVLSGAAVRTASGAHTVTDGAGRFRLVVAGDALPGGRRRTTLTAQRIGFTARTQDVVLRAGDSLAARFALCAQEVRLMRAAVGAVSADAPAAALADSYAANDESITNNQEVGVDEGGIVKLHGHHLVVLRRGRLFTVDIAARPAQPVDAVDAFGRDIDPNGTWYDELVTYGDRVVVVGYSYQRGGSELGVFRIDSAGRLHHLSTYQLRSNDYYSARNYASRVVGGKLVMYAPLYLSAGADLPSILPAMRRWTGSIDAAGFRRIASATRVFHPAPGTQLENLQALHSVTTCDLEREPLQCSSNVVVGPAARVFYVSGSAVYLWVSPWANDDDHDGDRGGDRSTVYRMPLDGGAPTAVRVMGSPVDQFSFSERAGELDVVVHGDAGGDAMWRSIVTKGATALARLPLAAFGDGAETLGAAAYTPLPDAGTGEFHNRFVGDHLLYGAGAGWVTGARPAADLFVLRVGAERPVRIRLPHGIDRLEAMGADAVVVGEGSDSLYFSAIALGRTPRAAQRYAMANAAQGEQRSHGFFYKPDASAGSRGAGILALPVASAGRPGYAHLRYGSASVAFIRNDGRAFTMLGELAAAPTDADDGCRASCVDWYGNARPIFARGRSFALLGYELVEGSIGDGAIRETARTSFAPPVIRAVRR